LFSALLSKVLTKLPKHRYSIVDVRNHRWYLKYETGKRLNSGPCAVSPVSVKRRRTSTSSSQPVQQAEGCRLNDDLVSHSQPLKSFSQPSHIENLVVNTQVASQYSNSIDGDYRHLCQRLVKRMTRFLTKLSVEKASDQLHLALHQMNYTVTKNAFNVVRVCL
jgi:serine/threonine protein kinase